MQKGKAVGADGFAIELLLKADTAVKHVFWEALRADIARGTIPDAWHVVLYVLLVKPPPNNANCVSGRREIALMAQGMKLLMHALRRTAYRRISTRLRTEQVGWTPGYGPHDAALGLTNTIKQAKLARHDLWILYIDLATMFPRMDRDLVSVGEALLGLPQEAIEWTLAIYGSKTRPEVMARCRFDSASGLMR